MRNPRKKSLLKRMALGLAFFAVVLGFSACGSADPQTVVQGGVVNLWNALNNPEDCAEWEGAYHPNLLSAGLVYDDVISTIAPGGLPCDEWTTLPTNTTPEIIPSSIRYADHPYVPGALMVGWAEEILDGVISTNYSNPVPVILAGNMALIYGNQRQFGEDLTFSYGAPNFTALVNPLALDATTVTQPTPVLTRWTNSPLFGVTYSVEATGGIFINDGVGNPITDTQVAFPFGPESLEVASIDPLDPLTGSVTVRMYDQFFTEVDSIVFELPQQAYPAVGSVQLSAETTAPYSTTGTLTGFDFEEMTDISFFLSDNQKGLGRTQQAHTDTVEINWINLFNVTPATNLSSSVGVSAWRNGVVLNISAGGTAAP